MDAQLRNAPNELDIGEPYQDDDKSSGDESDVEAR